MGFRAFAIEASADACLNINDYVLYGKGDKYKALASQSYWTWDTEEVMAMIDWMREYNLSCPRGEECRFLGFDMKPVNSACERLAEYLKGVMTDGLEETLAIIEAARTLGWHSDMQASAIGIERVMGLLVLRQIPFVDKSNPDSYRRALDMCRIIYQFVDCMRVHNKGGEDVNNPRDKHMAENVKFIIDSLPKGTKIVIWAHNGHIANGFTWKNTGQHLRERYGSRYYALGLTLGGGTFQTRKMDRANNTAGPLMEFPVYKIDGDLWEAEFLEISGGNYYFDLRGATAENEIIREWAMRNKPLLMLDEGYDPLDKREFFEYGAVLAQAYDGIVFTEKTERARSNPSGRRE
jgi:erythromycin esterase